MTPQKLYLKYKSSPQGGRWLKRMWGKRTCRKWSGKNIDDILETSIELESEEDKQAWYQLNFA